MIALMTLAACAWLALMILAPVLPVPLAGVAYLAGSLICHQLPERSFHIGATQLPVCARCVGIYAGFLACLLVKFRIPGSPFVMIAGAMPTAVTVALEWLGMWEPSNIARACAGVPLGAALAFVVVDAVAKLHYEPCAPQRPIAPRPPATLI